MTENVSSGSVSPLPWKNKVEEETLMRTKDKQDMFCSMPQSN